MMVMMMMMMVLSFHVSSWDW